ncbi:MAG: SRPBCC domain-containing protein [Saprospiraceae bacterium]
MKTSDYTISFLVDQTPKEAFEAINNVRGWWSETIEGSTHKLNDEFRYRHEDIHDSKQKLVEFIPDKKVVWLVTDSKLSFIKHKDEWTNTRISFEIERKGDMTQIRFTHLGLVPEVECYDSCSGGWSYYLNQSLLPLITTGTGRPDKKEKK